MQSCLTGVKILVTRSMAQSGEFSQRLLDLGAEVLEMPTLVITSPDSWQDLDWAIHNLQTYDWLILTSVNGVTNFIDRLEGLGHSLSALSHLKIAVVGVKTAQVLESYGRRPDLVPEEFIADRLADCLVQQFPMSGGTKILFPRVQSGGRDILVKELSAHGAQVDAVPAYESRCPDHISPVVLEALQNRAIHAITFTSSKTVRNFQALLHGVDSQWRQWIEGVKIISIGRQTSLTCSQVFHRESIEAQTATWEGMVQAICFTFTKNLIDSDPR